ncbi:hypothetical protein MP228_005949 [Amoeboaphelidium protococcarum]|nr:hypothetical protein MP228_005949 [Amoeboaphelidium protococcarum]
MDIQDRVLQAVDQKGALDSRQLGDIDSNTLLGLLKSLAGRSIVEYDTIESTQYAPTEEGEDIQRNGSYEVQVLCAVQQSGSDGVSMKDLQSKFGASNANVLKIGQMRAFKSKWLKKDGDQLKAAVELSSIVDEIQLQLKSIADSAATGGESQPPVEDAIIKDLLKRKLITAKKNVHFMVRKGAEFTVNPIKESTDITSENLQQLMISSDGLGDGQVKFKKYNFEAMGIPPQRGHVHPIQKVRSEFRQIFFEMGFEEMPTNQYVESSFWNFDSLFQPQDHPARDMHDTFFCKSPAKWNPAKDLEPYIERVGKVHSEGGYGSVGYGTEWKREEADSLLLRTHTTAVSSRMLYQLFQQPQFTPKKYFSIDKVFRNETLDATHLAEFHQVEGLIADYGLTVGHLIGFLGVFFTKLGLKDLKFKPTYNPYTEPSLEVFAYHPQLKKQIELGNSGMFRPEMLRPMIPPHKKEMHQFIDRLPEDVRVIAWGLSLERPTMIKYGFANIRELVGHKVDLNMVYDNSFCRLDKTGNVAVSQQ